MDEAPSAPSAAPPSSRRWRRDACRDRVRDRFGSPTRLTKQGAPAGSCLCLNVFPSRAVLPSRQRGHPSRDSARTSVGRAGRPAQTSPLTRAGRFTTVSDRRSFGTWRATCRALLPTSSGDPTAREPVRFGRGQPWEPRLQAHPPSSKGGQTSTFSRAEQPYRRCSAAPHFAPGAFLGKPRGLPRLNDPPHAGGAAPSPKSGRGVALCRGPTTSWGRPVRRHATSLGHPGRRPMKPAGEAGLIGVLGQA